MAVEFVEDSEWRKKLKQDADDRCNAALDGKLDEYKAKKAKERSERSTSNGSTKKAKKVD